MSITDDKKLDAKKRGNKTRQPDQAQNRKPNKVLTEKPLQLTEKPLQLQRPQPAQRPSEPVKLPSQPPEQRQEVPMQVEAAIVAAETPSTAAIVSVNTLPIDFRDIATAYVDYTRKSLAQTQAFVEKLAGVRSLAKALEMQAEFANQSYENYTAESQKIRGLCSAVAWQAFKPFESLVAKTAK